MTAELSNTKCLWDHSSKLSNTLRPHTLSWVSEALLLQIQGRLWTLLSRHRHRISRRVSQHTVRTACGRWNAWEIQGSLLEGRSVSPHAVEDSWVGLCLIHLLNLLKINPKGKWLWGRGEVLVYPTLSSEYCWWPLLPSYFPTQYATVVKAKSCTCAHTHTHTQLYLVFCSWCLGCHLHDRCIICWG
jgi:hypothetical protein